jgi:uncharacterized repeat protein (TIGR04076 family)
VDLWGVIYGTTAAYRVMTGQGFGHIFNTASLMPEDFCACCAWAWADIRKDILTVAYGGDMPGMRQRGTVITGCTDWLRPVIFKVERMEND